MGEKEFVLLKREFPTIFEHQRRLGCCRGWAPRIQLLCSEIMRQDPEKKVRVLQLKEKFGGLRFYIGEASQEVHNSVEAAERESFFICEFCGCDDGVTTEGNTWLKSLCEDCHKSRTRDSWKKYEI